MVSAMNKREYLRWGRNERRKMVAVHFVNFDVNEIEYSNPLSRGAMSLLVFEDEYFIDEREQLMHKLPDGTVESYWGTALYPQLHYDT
jgi:hypothetical protein